MTDKGPISERLRQASDLIRRGRSAEAIPLLDQVVNSDSRCAWALEERGRAKLFSGDIHGAISDFTTMIAIYPGNPKGFTSRAEARVAAGDIRGGIDDYSSAISIEPRHPYAFLQRGRLKMRVGDGVGAIADFSADMEFSTEGRLSGLLNRGKAKTLLGDFLGAVADLTEAIALEGEKPIFAPLFRGQAKLSAGDHGGAVDDFSIAIESFPHLANAYRLRAEGRALAGDSARAADDLAHYRELGGQDLPAYT